MLTQAGTSRRYRCDIASPEDQAAIGRLLRQPMPGRVSLSLEHEPDHRLAAEIQGDRRCQVVVHDQQAYDRVVACGARSVRELWIGGRPLRVGYLGGLRCEPTLRTAYRTLTGAFDGLFDSHQCDEAAFDLTSIMADNAVFRRAMERGLPELPRYVGVGELVTLTVRTRDRRTAAIRNVRLAVQADLPGIAERLAAHGLRYNGLPVWCEHDLLSPTRCRGLKLDDFLILRDGEKIAGCLAVWDQRAFKQVVVRDLAPALRPIRPWLNLCAMLSGRPALPPPNSPLSMVYASHAAFDEHDARAAVALLDAARASAYRKGAKLLTFALPAIHPLVPVLHKRYRAWTSRSVVYAVTRDETAPLDDRPVWMEIAAL